MRLSVTSSLAENIVAQALEGLSAARDQLVRELHTNTPDQTIAWQGLPQCLLGSCTPGVFLGSCSTG